ncbi:MAG TPA: cytochrome d ubiquinol oxidase subunit II [Rectinemataceae bacterium]|nr:cytochrome d ubiquinol oxidase subunit II [Rectinemataceae bacterium]
MTPLSVIWYILAALLFCAFAVADGFDLGAGILYGFERELGRRERILHAIAPVWGGSEIWLLAGMVALLVGFPRVYALVVRSLALPIVIAIAALVLRAIGIEFRLRGPSRAIGAVLDALIVVGSFVPALAMGFMGANLLQGLPIDAGGILQGGSAALLSPFSVLGALVSGIAFTLHGSTFLAMRTNGEFRGQIEGWAKTLLTMLLVLLVGGFLWSRTALRLRYATSMASAFFWVSLALGLLAYASVWVNVRFERRTAAFAGSSAGLAAIAICSASLLSPTMIPSTLDPSFALTVGNAAAGDDSLRSLLVYALVALPLVLVYVVISYRSIGRRRRRDR